MKVWSSPYHLQPRQSLNRLSSVNPREGALLKVEFSPDLVGYSDLHPHPELGDLPLQQQLTRLKQQTPTLQTKNSLHWALVDAHARRKGESLFAGLKLPSTHLTWTATDQLEAAFEIAHRLNYSHIKLKMGRDPDSGLKVLNNHSSELQSLVLRLDFNEAMRPKDFNSWWQRLSPEVKKCIDYVEDPFPFSATDWSQCPAPLAIDRGLSTETLKEFSHNVVIFKPAVSELFWLNSMNKRTIFSTYMDHPLGEMAAIYAAAHYFQTHEQIEICGLKTWPLFEPNDFSGVFNDSGSTLSFSTGTGFGFDEILKKQKWSLLI